MKKLFLAMLLLVNSFFAFAENGYELWLRYRPLPSSIQQTYRPYFQRIFIHADNKSANAIKNELSIAITALLGIQPVFYSDARLTGNTGLYINTDAGYAASITQQINKRQKETNAEGFYLYEGKNKKQQPVLSILSQSDQGSLYAVFHLLRMMQNQQTIRQLNLLSVPKLQLRLLNHWDNLNRSVERGYAGLSLWNWHTLPGYIDQRYIDYARANASIGINGTVLTNVNANATVLSAPYLLKVKALADVFRSYGIKVFLTARFSAPIEMGGLKTADPLDPAVKEWWKQKANEIYSLIPDFGGFLVKANSEGQPGPQDYKRTHADGANMLADAVSPHKGIIIWRAFVYAAENPVDRHKQAYDDFVPLDGLFRNNVMVQVKNGAIDFMPREPFHPLFGAMPRTPLMMEFQVTQEYLGQATQLVFLAPLFKEVLDADTYSKGKGSTVAKVIDGSLDQHSLNGMAGVSNIGNDINWCGHPFAQANWYALGRLAWDHSLSSDQIAEEWLRMSYNADPSFIQTTKNMMLRSREIMVNYMNPLGLHHIMGTGHHYGPAPWISNLNRPEWNPVYYHKADSMGIGFNRTASGSNAISQYQPEARKAWEHLNTCDEKYLLWFHHVSWNHTVSSGRTLWNELCHRYYNAADSVQWMITEWGQQQKKVDAQRFKEVDMLLHIQFAEAKWWRNACLLYFQTFSGQSIPAGLEQPDQTLDYYKKLRFPYAPGN